MGSRPIRVDDIFLVQFKIKIQEAAKKMNKKKLSILEASKYAKIEIIPFDFSRKKDSRKQSSHYLIVLLCCTLSLELLAGLYILSCIS